MDRQEARAAVTGFYKQFGQALVRLNEAARADADLEAEHATLLKARDALDARVKALEQQARRAEDRCSVLDHEVEAAEARAQAAISRSAERINLATLADERRLEALLIERRRFEAAAQKDLDTLQTALASVRSEAQRAHEASLEAMASDAERARQELLGLRAETERIRQRLQHAVQG